MEFIIAWFPILKFTILAGFIGLAFYIYKKGFKKTSYIIHILVLMGFIFSPIKYDGTNIKETQKRQVQQRTNDFDIVQCN